MISEEVHNKEVFAERVQSSANQSLVVTSFQRTFPQEWVSSNDNNNFQRLQLSNSETMGTVSGLLCSASKRASSAMKR